MNTTTTKLSHETISAIRVALRLTIQNNFPYRQEPSIRSLVKETTQALREMRNTQNLFQEKLPWLK